MKTVLKTICLLFIPVFSTLLSCAPSLYEAVRNNDIKTVQKVIVKSPDLNKPESGKNYHMFDCHYTPLMTAVDSGFTEIAKLLISKGADVNYYIYCDNRPNTPLVAASFNGNKDLCSLLIAHGADINKRSVYNTPLSAAALTGQKKLCSYLIDKGAEINPSHYDGYSPLTRAAQTGHNDIIELLMEKGADLNFQDEKGNTALMTACRHGHKETAELLISKGADINIKNNDSLTAVQLIPEKDNENIAGLFANEGSQKLKNWRLITNLEHDLRKVVWTGHQYVTVGDNGLIATSPDGKQWTVRESNTVENLTDIINSGNRLVAVGENSTIISSEDGITWGKRELDGSKISFYSITWSGSKMIALGDCGYGDKCLIASSVDGISWSIIKVKLKDAYHRLQSIIWTGKEFAAIGTYSGYTQKTGSIETMSPIVLISEDNGDNWSYSEGTVTFKKENSYSSSYLTCSTSKYVEGFDYLIKINTGYIAVSSTMHKIILTTDFISWRENPLPDKIKFTGIDYLRFMGVDQSVVCFSGSPSNAFWISGNGIDWQNDILPNISDSYEINAVARGDSNYVAVGKYGCILSFEDTTK